MYRKCTLSIAVLGLTLSMVTSSQAGFPHISAPKIQRPPVHVPRVTHNPGPDIQPHFRQPTPPRFQPPRPIGTNLKHLPQVHSLGPYQQKQLAHGFGSAVGYGVQTGATPYIGPAGGAMLGKAAGDRMGQHAQQKWTGKGLNNWNKPSHW